MTTRLFGLMESDIASSPLSFRKATLAHAGIVSALVNNGYRGEPIFTSLIVTPSISYSGRSTNRWPRTGSVTLSFFSSLINGS